MARIRTLWVVMGLVATSTLLAQVGPDPRENSFQFFVDGVQTAGIIGYNIQFNHDPLNRTDTRRLGTVYSPDNRRFTITVTQKGLNLLMDWINSATNTGVPETKGVSIVAKDNQGSILARWELTGVTPATFTSTGTGVLTEVDATIEFAYDTLTLTQARPS